MSTSPVTTRDINEARSILTVISLYFQRDYFYRTQFKRAYVWPFLATLASCSSGVAIFGAVITTGGQATGPVMSSVAVAAVGFMYLAWGLGLAHIVVWAISKVWRHRIDYDGPHA